MAKKKNEKKKASACELPGRFVGGAVGVPERVDENGKPLKKPRRS